MNTFDMESQMAVQKDPGLSHLNILETKATHNGKPTLSQADKSVCKDEVPEDIRAFFGHPLTAASSALDGTDGSQASAMALLHEYQNLPAIDKVDLKIGERYESIHDILRADLRRDTSASDYLILMNADVDAFLNRDGSQPEELAEGGLLTQELTVVDLNQDLSSVARTYQPDMAAGIEIQTLPDSAAQDENANKVHCKVPDQSDADFMLDLHKEVQNNITLDEFSLFDSTNSSPRTMHSDLRQEVPCSSQHRVHPQENRNSPLTVFSSTSFNSNIIAVPGPPLHVRPQGLPPLLHIPSPPQGALLHTVAEDGSTITLYPTGPAIPINCVRPPPGLIKLSPEEFRKLGSLPSHPMPQGLLHFPPGMHLLPRVPIRPPIRAQTLPSIPSPGIQGIPATDLQRPHGSGFFPQVSSSALPRALPPLPHFMTQTPLPKPHVNMPKAPQHGQCSSPTPPQTVKQTVLPIPVLFAQQSGVLNVSQARTQSPFQNSPHIAQQSHLSTSQPLQQPPKPSPLLHSRSNSDTGLTMPQSGIQPYLNLPQHIGNSPLPGSIRSENQVSLTTDPYDTKLLTSMSNGIKAEVPSPSGNGNEIPLPSISQATISPQRIMFSVAGSGSKDVLASNSSALVQYLRNPVAAVSSPKVDSVSLFEKWFPVNTISSSIGLPSNNNATSSSSSVAGQPAVSNLPKSPVSGTGESVSILKSAILSSLATKSNTSKRAATTITHLMPDLTPSIQKNVAIVSESLTPPPSYMESFCQSRGTPSPTMPYLEPNSPTAGSKTFIPQSPVNAPILSNAHMSQQLTTKQTLPSIRSIPLSPTKSKVPQKITSVPDSPKCRPLPPIASISKTPGGRPLPAPSISNLFSSVAATLNQVSPSAISTSHHHQAAVTVSSTLASAFQLPPTPSSMDSQSIPASPLSNVDAIDSSGRCSPGDAIKPSDSTKRIIQVLTEKLKRNQQRPSIDRNQVSFNDINDILRESLGRHSIGDRLGLEHSELDQLDTLMCAGQPSDIPSMELEWPSSSLEEAIEYDIASEITPVSSFSSSDPCLNNPLPSRLNTNPPRTSPFSTSSSPLPLSSPISSSMNSVFFPDLIGGGFNHTSSSSAQYMPPLPTNPSPSPPSTPVNEFEAQPLVIQPQEQNRTPNLPNIMAQAIGAPYADLKSPDSGFGTEACVSPSDPSMLFGDLSNPETIGSEVTRDRVPKRRRSSNTSQKSIGQASAKQNSPIIIPKLENDLGLGYTYILETCTSASQRIEEDRMTYMNKGQFYGLTLDYTPAGRSMRSPIVKTLIAVVFREEKSVTDELKAWEFWHSRQHSVKHRIIDIDTKNSIGVVPNSIYEISHNAVVVRWKPLDSAAKISVAINCLSTDFSNQKGVKGLPLHIQVDTFEEGSFLPVHRGYCQVKIFCDKGAERKARDEERRKEARIKTPDSPVADNKFKKLELYHLPRELSDFYAMANLTQKPILFNPMTDYMSVDPHSLYNDQLCVGPILADPMMSPTKRPRLEIDNSERVLLYVRESHESIYTALLLEHPTLTSLGHAIEEKYKIPSSNIHNIYKRSKKGILVKMDDNIIRHYSYETTFVISITKNENILDCQAYDVTLAEVDSAV